MRRTKKTTGKPQNKEKFSLLMLVFDDTGARYVLAPFNVPKNSTDFLDPLAQLSNLLEAACGQKMKLTELGFLTRSTTFDYFPNMCFKDMIDACLVVQCPRDITRGKMQHFADCGDLFAIARSAGKKFTKNAAIFFEGNFRLVFGIGKEVPFVTFQTTTVIDSEESDDEDSEASFSAPAVQRSFGPNQSSAATVEEESNMLNSWTVGGIFGTRQSIWSSDNPTIVNMDISSGDRTKFVQILNGLKPLCVVRHDIIGVHEHVKGDIYAPGAYRNLSGLMKAVGIIELNGKQHGHCVRIGPTTALTCLHVIAGSHSSVMHYRFQAEDGKWEEPGVIQAETIIPYDKFDLAVFQCCSNSNCRPPQVNVAYNVKFLYGFEKAQPLCLLRNDRIGTNIATGSSSKILACTGNLHTLHSCVVAYKIETAGGYSGCPVFDECGNLVALHAQASGLKFPRNKNSFNIGIRVDLWLYIVFGIGSKYHTTRGVAKAAGLGIVATEAVHDFNINM